MVDINRQIKLFIRKLARTGNYTDGDLSEVYDHISESVKRSIEQGLSPEEALHKSTDRWGSVEEISKNEMNVKMTKRFMFPVRFTTMFRRMVMPKTGTLINLIGLAVALSTVMVIYIYVKKEHDYDKHHTNFENIYRVVLDNTSTSGVTRFVTTGPPTGKVLSEEFPQVKNFVRFKSDDQHLVTYENKMFHEEHLYYVDSTVFDVFNYEFISGDKATALDRPNTVVITEEMATKYFGSDDALGKMLKVDGDREFIVTGVIRSNHRTHIKVDFFVSFSSYIYPDFGSPNSWSWVTFYNYIVLDKDVSKEEFIDMLPDLVVKNFGEDRVKSVRFDLQAVTDIYLTPSSNVSAEIGPTSNRLYSQVMIYAGLLILIIAGFNYINLTTAQASRRAKEVAIKKFLGVDKHSLIIGFLLEAFALTGIAILISFFASYFFINYLGGIIDITTSEYITYLPEMLYMAGGILITLTFLIGFYPATLLASINSKQVLRTGKVLKIGSGALMRSMFVGLQFAISIILIIGSMVIHEQLSFIKNKDLGFNRSDILIIPLQNADMRDRYNAFKNRLAGRSKLNMIGAARVGMEGLHGSYQYVPRGGDLEDAPRMSILPVSYNFIETLNIELVSGRLFNEDYRTDTLRQFIMNETAIKLMGWSPEQAIDQHGMLTGQGGIYGRVVGVVRDFHFEPLQNSIEPLILWLTPENAHYVYIKTNGGDHSKILTEIKEDFKAVYADYPFEWELLDDRLQKTYKSEDTFGTMIRLFSGLAILVACFGLFGLTIFVVSEKISDISIRKVLGASTIRLFFTLNLKLVLLVVMASAVAIPIGYWLAIIWLNNFAYSIDLSWEIFLLAVMLTFLTVFVTVGYQTIKASMTSPVKILREN